MRSTDCPVRSAISWARSFFARIDCSACILMSLAVPPIPPGGWCIMIRACGSAYRLPGAPQASSTCPIEATRPIAYVATSLLMKFIVS